MVATFYSDVFRSCRAIIMEFMCIKVLHVKLVTFTSAHTMLINVKISEPFTLTAYVTLLLRYILLQYLQSYFSCILLC
jgi:hypothetical protein